MRVVEKQVHKDVPSLSIAVRIRNHFKSLRIYVTQFSRVVSFHSWQGLGPLCHLRHGIEKHIGNFGLFSLKSFAHHYEGSFWRPEVSSVIWHCPHFLGCKPGDSWQRSPDSPYSLSCSLSCALHPCLSLVCFISASGSSRLSYKSEGVAHIVISESFSLFSLSPVACEFSV